MSWFKRVQKAPKTLVIYDQSSTALMHFKERYKALGYDVVTVLAVDPKYDRAPLRDDNHRVVFVAASAAADHAQDNADPKFDSRFPEKLEYVDYIVSTCEGWKEVLTQEIVNKEGQPRADFILGNQTLARATNIQSGNNMMSAAQEVLPNVPRVMHSNGYGAARTLNFKDEALRASTSHGHVDKQDKTGVPPAHRVFQLITQQREKALAA